MWLDRTSRAPSARSALLAAALILGAVTAQAQSAAPSPRPPHDLATLDLEQLMQLEVVVAASKRAQNTRDVPSFVSVITAADIREHGYRTLSDVLKTLPSFYVANDRNYSYIGVRGFERPGDYSSRVLLLLNGLRTNENVYNQAYIGEEFIVDLDLIERIEVIRGPSAALYGSNAFFAVINVVTKPGRELNGGEVATTAASFGTYAGRVSYGKSVAADADLLVSASFSDSKGQNLYYPEYDSPATNNGIVKGGDVESFHKLLATMTKGNFSFQASNVSRTKGIPTAAFGMLFNDARARTIDGLSLASVSYARAFEHGTTVSTRLHAGRWTYKGSYVYDDPAPLYLDSDVGEWWGADVDVTRALFSRHFLTAGAEYRNNNKQDQLSYVPDPLAVYTDLHKTSVNWGLFAQDEIALFEHLTLSAGLRYDHYVTFGAALSPRVGLIYNPRHETTFKLLAGSAFRAPNEYELHFATDMFKPNPALRPEHIQTLELVAQQMIGGGMQITAAAFRNTMRDLLVQLVDPADAMLVFANSEEIRSNGLELGLDLNRGHGPTGHLSYSLQKSEDDVTGTELTNSPRHMGKLQVNVPLRGSALSAGFDAQYMSTRTTLAGRAANAYTIVNLSMLAPRVLGRIALTATVYNLFGAVYGTPGSDSHLQDVIQQDGRNFRVKSTLHF